MAKAIELDCYIKFRNARVNSALADVTSARLVYPLDERGKCPLLSCIVYLLLIAWPVQREEL